MLPPPDRPTVLSAADRQRLRHLVDQERRRLVAAADTTPKRERCTGCGRPLYTYTPGCKQCDNRRWHRARRATA